MHRSLSENTSSLLPVLFASTQLADDSLLSQPPSDQGDGLNTSTCSSATQYFNLDDSACTSELLSVHQTGLMFMSPEQLQSIADALHASQSLQVREGHSFNGD